MGRVASKQSRSQASWSIFACSSSLLAVLAVGCGSSHETAKLAITQPSQGKQFTLADDENADREGLQTTVVVASSRLGETEGVSLYLDGAPFAEPQTPNGSNGAVTFSDVTLPSGDHQIEARARNGAVRSLAVTISVVDRCAEVRFTTPEVPSSGSVTLVGADDRDGEACGATFESKFVVSTDAGNGQTARLYVNGTLRATTTVDGTVATFDNVGLDNRGLDPNRVEVEVESSNGSTCRQSLPADVFVACDGPSCSITKPNTTTPYLNSTNDSDKSAAGLQTDIEVTTNADGAGQNIRLIVDRMSDDAPSKLPVAMGTSAAATFATTLTEGVHTAQGECKNAAGVATRSGLAQWTVDITPCAIAITSPTEAQLFPPDAPTDLPVSGTVTGDQCTAIRAGLKSNITSVGFSNISGGTFNTTAKRSTSRNQVIAAEVRDVAGNVTQTEVSIVFVSNAPQLAIVTPTAASAFNQGGGNQAGGVPYIVDKDLNSTTCEAEFVVNCTELGSPVTLARVGDAADLPGGSATCTAATGLPNPFTGQARFPSVSLPSISQSPNTLSIIAKQNNGVDGASDPVAVKADCEPPSLFLTRPVCTDGKFSLQTSQDESTGASGLAGIQYRTVASFSSSSSAAPSATLRILLGGADVPQTPSTSTPSSSATVSFSNATFQTAGDHELFIQATDAMNNTGKTPSCTVSIIDIPVVTITSPISGATFTSASTDCDAGRAGLQIPVSATTDAPAGSAATVQIGSGAVVNAIVGAGSGATRPIVSTATSQPACVDAPDGNPVPVKVSVTDPVKGPASATINIIVNSVAPSLTIGDLAISRTINPRAWQVELAWTAVADGNGNAFKRYLLRCSETAYPANSVDRTAWWNAATTRVSMKTTPATAGRQTETVDLPNFRMGTSHYCVLRGQDAANQLTPLPAGALQAKLDFRQQAIMPAVAIAKFAQSIVAVGDISGDGADDFLIGAGGSAPAQAPAVYLYLGGSTLAASPTVTIGATDATGLFGRAVAAIGDFNGDGRSDFAIGDPSTSANQGSVYVFFGKDVANPWPATIDASNGGACGADLCIRGAETTGTLGFTLAPAGNFDGDGPSDLAIGAPLLGSSTGRVYIALGSTTFASNTVELSATSTALRAFAIDPPPGVGVTRSFGSGLAGVRNFNGDEYDDLAVSSPGRALNPTVDGRVFTVAGRPYSGSGVTFIDDAVQVIATQPGNFGIGVTNIGDFNGDNVDDIAVYRGLTGIVGISVFFGGFDGYAAARSFTLNDDQSATLGSFLGLSTAIGSHPFLGPKIGDLDQDNRTDLLVGSGNPPPPPTGTDDNGAAQIFYGAMPATSTVQRSAADVTLQPGGKRQKVVAYVRDVNRDGFMDLVVGDPNSSSCYLYY